MNLNVCTKQNLKDSDFICEERRNYKMMTLNLENSHFLNS